MGIATLSDVLLLGRQKRVGVPCLWGGTVEQILGYVRAAEELDAPIVICRNRSLAPELSSQYGFDIILSAARGTKVPVAVTLDHGASIEECVRAIRAGASGVMYDGSHLPYEENVANTREVVRIAHAVGVSVEGEIGSVGGSAIEYGTEEAPESVLTDPAQAVSFAEETGVDALAVSVGNAHGLYRGTPNIRYDLIAAIRGRVSVPLVMHGGSGLPEPEYPKIVAAGITKVNFYSEMSRRATESLKRFLENDDGSLLSHNVLRHMIAAHAEESRRVLTLLGYDLR